MDASDIRDKDSFKAWLETLPERVGEDEARRIAVWLAARMALRVLPLVWHFRTDKDTGRFDRSPTPVLRCLLISSASAKVPTVDFGKAAAAAAEAATAITDTASSANSIAHVATACFSAIAYVAASSDITDAAYHAGTASFAAYFAAGDAFATYDLISSDAFHLNAGVACLPLWPKRAPEGWLPLSEPSSGDWQFWINWYDDILQGRPQNGPMLAEIALIAPKHWDAGPEVVNPMIALIVEKHRLMAEAGALKEQVQQACTALHDLERRAHNNPPELVDEGVAEARQAITLIWEVLDQAETELAQPAPDPSKLKALAERLLALCKTIATYCGGKIDIALDKAAEELGGTGAKWAIHLGAASLASQHPQVQGFGRALLDFVAKL